MKNKKIRTEEVLFVAGVLIFFCSGLIVSLCLRIMVYFRGNIDPGQYLWLYNIPGYTSLTLLGLSVSLFIWRWLQNRRKISSTEATVNAAFKKCDDM